MFKEKLTREKFGKLIIEIPNWESCLTERQLKIIQRWYYNNESYTQIAKELRVNLATVHAQIKGVNQYGKGGAYKAIAGLKSAISRRENNINKEKL